MITTNMYLQKCLFFRDFDDNIYLENRSDKIINNRIYSLPVNIVP